MLQVCDRLMQHSFGATRDRPVEAREGAEVGDMAQVGLKERICAFSFRFVGLRFAQPPYPLEMTLGLGHIEP